MPEPVKPPSYTKVDDGMDWANAGAVKAASTATRYGENNVKLERLYEGLTSH